ncbi:MAG: DUF4286 family protein [Deltaproteobacteria bacterium]|nr:DUF4286 family protein [Deltaproteobacteria bacterium]
MSSISYTVACTLAHQQIADRWLAWLRDGHLEDVLRAGALSAEVFRMDGEQGSTEVRYEVRYVFASRAAFDAYERDHAPRLREEGLSLFPLDLGLAYQRSVGESVLISPTS